MTIELSLECIRIHLLMKSSLVSSSAIEDFYFNHLKGKSARQRVHQEDFVEFPAISISIHEKCSHNYQEIILYFCKNTNFLFTVRLHLESLLLSKFQQIN
ncbi:unnamed protein product [Orchesella dallaii]|uniref:Uncharacterized protein n=1 Tax=Orchesella dallaii TaxID=48710 RepID=A0ABP1PJY9_9HEXA